jgi:hypothetical protein
LLAEFTVAIDGRLVDGRIVESSGNADVDRAALKYIPTTLSGRPAIGADGEVLSTGKIKLGYGNAERPVAPETASSVTPPITEGDRIAAEGARILRMRCKDFVWEFDQMVSLHARPADEVMPRTAMAVYLAAKKLPQTELAKVLKAGRKGIPASAKSCRSQPEAMFVEAALVPTFDALMK